MLTTHLSMRVAWHDHSWDGTVCRAPCDNSFCVALDRVREARDEEAEARIAGKPWSDLPADRLPPCARQSHKQVTWPTGWAQENCSPSPEA